jgi:hypothetical protein
MKKTRIIVVFALLGCNSLFSQTQTNTVEVKSSKTSPEVATVKAEKPKQEVANSENTKPLGTISPVKLVASRKEGTTTINH